MIATLANRAGKTIGSIDVPPELMPEHVYCDRCGDCLLCSPHDAEEWCATGGWWVLYEGDEDYERIVQAVGGVPSRGEGEPNG